MKTLYMCRHAKSSWEHDVIDHQRPLKGRGKRDGVLMSNHIGQICDAPELIVSSEAVRALVTATYFKEAWQMPDEKFIRNNNLYDFSGQEVMKVVAQLDDSKDCIMIVGHNHAFTSIANMLGNKYFDNLPTCGFVAIEFDVDKWKDITNGKTVKQIFPRDLK